MEYKLKRISTAGIPEAIAKAELYRSLNEPEEAESICRDILAVEPTASARLAPSWPRSHRPVHRRSVRSRTGKRKRSSSDSSDPYERLYYAGIVYERRAKAQFNAGQPPHVLLPLFEQALHTFAEAEKISPPGNDDAILRWNRCVRLLQNRTYVWDVWDQERVPLETEDAPPT